MLDYCGPVWSGALTLGNQLDIKVGCEVRGAKFDSEDLCLLAMGQHILTVKIRYLDILATT